MAAKQPERRDGGTTKTAATLTSFAWNLRLDDTPTISGDIAEPISIPGTGQQAMIPLRMNLDLYGFFKDKGYEKILDLALALGGANGSASRVTLRAKPTIRTEFGPLDLSRRDRYHRQGVPGEVTDTLPTVRSTQNHGVCTRVH